MRLCPLSLLLVTTFKTVRSNLLCLILLATILHHLPRRSRRIRGQQTLLLSCKSRLCRIHVHLFTIFKTLRMHQVLCHILLTLMLQLLTTSHSPSQAFTITTAAFPLQDDGLESVKDDVLALLQHSLPKSRTRANIVTNQYTPRGRLFGGYATRD